jgi:hypothetical protein
MARRQHKMAITNKIAQNNNKTVHSMEMAIRRFRIAIRQHPKAHFLYNFFIIKKKSVVLTIDVALHPSKGLQSTGPKSQYAKPRV